MKERRTTLNKNRIVLFVCAAAVVVIGLVFIIRTNSSTSTRNVQGTIGVPANTQLDQHDPFTNVAYIPATVDPSTIRFEKLRVVELASKTKTTTNPEICKERQFRESDSAYCQTVTVVERVKGLEAKYSYNGPVISSGETVLGRDEFSVYFRPEDVGAVGPVEKLNREQAESLFEVSTSRPAIEQKVIDKEHSQFCDGSYVDGNWTHTDPKCQDHVQYINKTVPSPNLLVQVDLRHLAARPAGSAMN
jgi:hypothetical protein